MQTDRIRDAVRELLIAIGENPDRPELSQTPQKVAEAYASFFRGINQDPHAALADTMPAQNSELVMLKDIELVSICEHHLLPFTGVAHIAYLPTGRLLRGHAGGVCGRPCESLVVAVLASQDGCGTGEGYHPVACRGPAAKVGRSIGRRQIDSPVCLSAGDAKQPGFVPSCAGCARWNCFGRQTHADQHPASGPAVVEQPLDGRAVGEDGGAVSPFGR